MKKIIPVVLAIAALIILGSSTYSVREDEAILISQFGKVQYVEDKPGLHFKVPFIQATKSIYTANILKDYWNFLRELQKTLLPITQMRNSILRQLQMNLCFLPKDFSRKLWKLRFMKLPGKSTDLFKTQ